jgi:hypothetical protein
MADKKMRTFSVTLRNGTGYPVEAAYWMCGGSAGIGGALEADGFVVFKALDHHIVLGVARDEVLSIRELPED